MIVHKKTLRKVKASITRLGHMRKLDSRIKLNLEKNATADSNQSLYNNNNKLQQSKLLLALVAIMYVFIRAVIWWYDSILS
ncbi:hypothetical protein BpHYR1_007471 [Brachionus plicatilis]|uniref:Uncharacterized protein n=1 Tax=Brachionus plicatilis TaxID=10195 RepID=A0A3M7Q6K7_BRAPC|nr:hypothetical protein BpHYR1_007471 [Brachionus plicatilis]